MAKLEQQLKNIMRWVDDRLPVTETYEKHMSKYYAPKNFNIWYIFGVLSFVVLVNQLLTGIWLTMSYTPTGGIWLVVTVHAFHWRIGIFCSGLSAYVSWSDVRLLSETERTDLGLRYADIFGTDG
jgi:quinol-cytochrome oxidoreductase complex cytochrome b subunit